MRDDQCTAIMAAILLSASKELRPLTPRDACLVAEDLLEQVLIDQTTASDRKSSEM